MTKSGFLKIFFQLFIILSGCFILWNVSFFQPYSFHYPPQIAYKPLKNTKIESVIVAPGKHYARNFSGEFLHGKHYRFLWALPVKVPVLDLKNEYGGLEILSRGGGMQTIRLNLKDARGKIYSLRSVDKDPVNVLPEFVRPTIATAFVRDQISATDPFATQVVAALSAAAAIPHTSQKLVFIKPHNADLQKFNIHAGGLFYLSPKYPEINELQKPSETFVGIFSSEEMLHNLAKAPTTAAIDTALFLKCRLFDLYIGDWDRHAGQWDWAGFSAQNHTVFRPIPKDRDQAFSFYQDGILPYLLSRNFAVQKISSFTPEYDDIAGFSMNGSALDDRFFRNLPWQKFSEQAVLLQTRLTDAALKSVLEKYPPEVSKAYKEKQFKTLTRRQQDLVKAAEVYYHIIRERNAGLDKKPGILNQK